MNEITRVIEREARRIVGRGPETAALVGVLESVEHLWDRRYLAEIGHGESGSFRARMDLEIALERFAGVVGG